MGATKTEHYTASQNELALVLKALGHPARVAIVQFLLQSETCICNDIVDVLPLSQPTVSQHLRELKNAGLIKGSIDGNSICYCINNEVFIKFKSVFGPLLDACCADASGKCC
jgi:ArsR family transcriptional regulator, arsenate/arsenite/antimonite-responsive transcriptional repressor